MKDPGPPLTPKTLAGFKRRDVLLGAASAAAVMASSISDGALMAQPASPKSRSSARRSPIAKPYAAPVNTGPSSKTVPQLGTTASAPGTPYVIPTAPKWSSTSLFTVGNEINGYHFCGIPDGLGAFDNGNGTITVLVNHELDAQLGAIRSHGGTGAFVSRWVIDTSTLDVISGDDFIAAPAKFNLWSGTAWAPADAWAGSAVNMDRLCSADLAPVSAFYNRATKTGYNGHIFLTGEEGTARPDRKNRAFAFVAADGSAYELPAFSFGTAGSEQDPPPAWENLLAHPATGDTALVVGNCDGGTSRVFAYIGTKKTKGSPIEKAGLADGRLFSLRVEDVWRENRETNVGLQKSLLGRGIGKRISLVETSRGTSFARPEDGAWDPRRPNVYYFASSDVNNYASPHSSREGADAEQVGRSRLWAVTFDDVKNIATDGSPTAKIELLLDGTEGGDMFDNITVDRAGIVYLCEDTGDARHNNKIWAYDTKTGTFSTIMMLDPAKFGDVVNKQYTPPTRPFNDDKEISGILDVTALFEKARWFRRGSTVLLVTTQAHFGYDSQDPIGRQISEGGQLLLLVKAP